MTTNLKKQLPRYANYLILLFAIVGLLVLLVQPVYAACSVCGHASVQPLTPAINANTELTGGGYYQLAGDVAANSYTLTFSGAGKTYFLCLNGHQLNMQVEVRKGATLTICDCAGGGYVKSLMAGKVPYQETSLETKSYVTIDSGNFGRVECTPSAELVVQNGTIERLYNCGTTVINGGTFTTAIGDAVQNNQYHNQASPPRTRTWYGHLTINAGTFTGKRSALYNSSGATVVINGGIFTGEESGICYYSENNLTITGGTVQSTAGPGIKDVSNIRGGGNNITITGGSIKGAAGQNSIKTGSTGGQIHLSGNFQLQGPIEVRVTATEANSTNIYIDGPMGADEIQIALEMTNDNLDTSSVVRISDTSTATLADLQKFTSATDGSVLVVDPTNKTLGVFYPQFITDQPAVDDMTAEVETLPGFDIIYRWLYADTQTGAGTPIAGATAATLPPSSMEKTGWYWCEATWVEILDPTETYVRTTDKVYVHFHNECGNSSCAEHTQGQQFTPIDTYAELQTALMTGGSYVLIADSNGDFAVPNNIDQQVVSANTTLCLGEVASLDLGSIGLTVNSNAALTLCTCASTGGEVKLTKTSTCEPRVEVYGTLTLHSVGLTINAKSTSGVKNMGEMFVNGASIAVTNADVGIYHGGTTLAFDDGVSVSAPVSEVYLANGKMITLNGGAAALADAIVVDTEVVPSYGTGRVAVAQGADSAPLNNAALEKVLSPNTYFSELSDDEKWILFGSHGGWVNGFCEHGNFQPCEKDANGNYVITNAGQLYWFADRVNNHNETTAKAVLANNIEVNTLSYDAAGNVQGTPRKWMPIKEFNGVFNGQNHTITGLFVQDNTASYVGLFGKLGSSANVSNVKLQSSHFEAAHHVGAIAGYSYNNIDNCHGVNNKIIAVGSVPSSGYGNCSYAGGICGENRWKVKNCTNSGGVVCAVGNMVGGICGSTEFIAIENSTNSASVTGYAFVGGMAGGMAGATGCTNSGEVNAIGSLPFMYTSDLDFGNCSFAGGINGAGAAEDCTNTGTVKGNKNAVGGISGAGYSHTNCINTGDIEGGALVGGIVGLSQNDIKACTNKGDITAKSDNSVLGMGVPLDIVGGISGWALGGSVQQCANMGSITGSAGAGGICGIFGMLSSDEEIIDCYNLGSVQEVPSAVLTAAGGLTGAQAFPNTVKNSYNAGTGTGNVAPLLSTVSAPGVSGIFDSTETTNCYYLASATSTDGGRTAAQFESGEIAWLLNGNASNDPEAILVWGQDLKRDAADIEFDKTPTLGGAQVYYGFKEGDTSTSDKTYSNSRRYTAAPISIANAVVVLSEDEFTYDGTEKEADVISVSLLTRASLAADAYTVSGNKATNAGTYTVTVTALEGSGYYGSSTVEFTILPKSVTAAVTVADKVYDGTCTATVTEVTLNGILSTDTVGVAGGTAWFADAAVGNDKPVTFTGFSLTGAAAANYSLQMPTNVVANITPAPATPANTGTANRANPTTGIGR